MGNLLYPPEIELVHERLTKLMQRRAEKGRPLAQTDVAQGAGLSPASISNFINRKDVCNPESLAAAIKAYVEREELKDEAGMLRIPFAETRQAKAIIQAYRYALQHSRMVVVTGGAGFGKTRTLEEIQRKDRTAVVVTAWSMMGASGLLKELCEAVGVGQRGLQTALMKRLRAKLTDSGRAVIIDDAHTLKFGALDMLRYVYDQCGIGLMLIGIPTLRRQFLGTDEETEQLASRVSGRVFELPEVTADDAAKIFQAAMGERKAEQAMKLLDAHPDVLASARRLGNVIEDASAFASKQGAVLAIEHIQRALKAA